MRNFMKCVKSTIPRAANAIFSETSEGNLAYQTTEYDITRELRSESGHVIIQKGDSGSAFWTTQILDSKEKVVLVALVQGQIRTRTIPFGSFDTIWGEYLNNTNLQCRQLAVKITTEMIQWLDTTELLSLLAGL